MGAAEEEGAGAGEPLSAGSGEGRVTPTLALTGGTVVVSLDPPAVVDADVVLAGDRVLAIGTAPAGIPRRDCSGAIVMPGNVCAHHHLYSALARGMPYNLAPPANFTEILQRIWWRLDCALDAPSIRASALTGGLDALRCGTTAIVDHHASPNAIDGSLDVIAEALEELGLRSVLCYEVTDRDGPERAAGGIAENARFIGSSSSRDLTRGMMGAHASFTLSDETLAATVEAAGAAGIHIHVAEDGADERDSEALYGCRVVERLERAGVVTASSLLAHCVQVDGREISLVESAGATVVCNHRSNMNNGVGFSPFALRGGAAGGAAAGPSDGSSAEASMPAGLTSTRVALGTDGIGGDMFAEVAAGFFRSREADLAVPFGWPLERLAESARFAGRAFGEPTLGTITAGAPADIVVLDLPSPTPLEAGNLAGHFVFGFTAARVRDVYVAGQAVVEDHRSTRVDEAEIAEKSRLEARKLWDRMDALPAHGFSPKEARG